MRTPCVPSGNMGPRRDLVVLDFPYRSLMERDRVHRQIQSEDPTATSVILPVRAGRRGATAHNQPPAHQGGEAGQTNVVVKVCRPLGAQRPCMSRQ